MEIEYIGKCVYVKDKGILAIGDLHLGFEEALNRAGVFVARQNFKEMMEQLDRIFDVVGRVKEVVLLGDVKHDFGSVLRQERDDIRRLLDYLKDRAGKIIIIKGNHDKIIEVLADREKAEIRDFYINGEYCFLHGDRDFPEIHQKKIKCWILGHAHPAVTLTDGIKTEKYKCFLEGEYEKRKVVIVPSFIEYHEGSDPREHEFGLAWDFRLGKFKVMIVGEEMKVMDFGRLDKLGT